jgi:signal transduction histidine kinase/CheY-like chemotaxis protein
MLEKIKRKIMGFSLKTKFLTYVIAAIIVMGILFCGYYVYQFNRVLTQELEKRGESIAKHLAYQSKYGVMTKNKEILNQALVAAIHKESLGKDVTSAVIYDAEGRILAEKHKSISKIKTFGYSKIKGIDFKTGPHVSYSQSITLPLLNVLVPIEITEIGGKGPGWDPEDTLIDEDEYYQPKAADITTIGYVQITMSLQKLTDEKRAILKGGFLIILLVMGTGVAFSFAFVQLMIRPIKAMTQTAIKITQGDLSLRVKKYAQDEIGVFGDCFNRMVDSLEKRNNEIQQLNQSLEQKVKERTRELEIANKQLQEQNVKLKENDRLKSEFLANMSHELRTPLNAIIGFSRVILKGIDGPITELQQTDLTSIHNSGRHLLTLINDVLDLAKIESGRLELQPEELDVKEVAEGVMNTCEALVKDKNLKLIERIEPGLPHIIADKTRFRQILLNILSNAIKFTYEGSVVLEVKNLAKEHKILISVTDTGIGIKEEDIPKVFEKFRQIDGSSTRLEGGTGLGMAITKEFVEIHRGRIWVESKFGVGSTFYVELPVNGNSSKPAAVSKQRYSEKPYLLPDKDRQRQVMVVEDEPQMIKLYKRYLSQEGYKIIPVTDSRKALAIAKKTKPYAIILDIMLPYRDGWEVIQDLKADKQTRNIPVIISSIVNNKSMGFALGATAYLVKPFTQEELLEALTSLNHRAKKIVIIDDNPDDISLIKKMLGNRKYIYHQAYNGNQGLELIKKELPDLIILDLMMPVLDGFGMLRSIRTDQTIRDIPVIVISAKEVKQEQQQRLKQESSVVSFLQKGSYDEKELLTDVLTALNCC